MHVNLRSLPQILLISGSLAAMTLAPTLLNAQGDPPPGAARLAHLEGNVSIQPYGTDGWGQAASNMPVGAGDRIFADQSAMGELQASQVRAYFNSGSDLTLISLNYQGVELGVGSGSFSIFSDGFPSGSGFSVQTPNGAVTVAGRAGFRIDTYPDQQTTIITNFSNFGGITLNGGGGFYMQLGYGQSVQLTGTNPVLAQPLQPAAEDGFGHWSSALESHRFNSVSAQYVSPDLPGYDELDAAGNWQPQSDYGPIWFPHVDAGWAPYHFGHWVSMPFYGWTWVADEPWGAAPFHYGRWVTVGGRWGWIPGAREAQPVWSPAQVVFAGGVQFGGGSVSVWFPLGPGEPYKPWYPCSPTYINQINITNIHESRVVHVQTTYNVVNITNVTYVNRAVGVTAMNQRDFAAGHPAQTAAVKVNPQQLEHIQPAKPEAPPPAQRQIIRPTAKPAAAPAARPVLINNKGQQAAAVPNAKPVAIPARPAPPAPKPIPGHTPTGTPTVGNKPVPAMAPAKSNAPAAPAPKAAAAPTPQKSAPPAAKPATEPAPKATPPAAKPVTPPAHPQAAAPKASEPKPAVKPQSAPEAKTAPPGKDNKKNNQKKEEKPKPPEKPE
jgi:hypothetical protein